MPFKMLGISNDVDSCECCGRTGLRKTIILGKLDPDGSVTDVLHFGTSCAGKALAIKATKAAIERMATDAQTKIEQEERNRIWDVCPSESGVIWIVESIGCNGGSIRTLCQATGTRSAIHNWASKKYPNACINVRISRKG